MNRRRTRPRAGSPPVVAVAFVAALAGCAKGGDDVADTTSTGDDTDTGAPSHPLVPDEYKYLWDTDACTTQDGKTGARVYIVGDGEIDASRNVSITETWYWFFGTGDWSDDCADPFAMTGVGAPLDFHLDCASCDEGYDVTRTLDRTTSPAPCSMKYHSLFDASEEQSSYDAELLLDTVTSSGDPNPDGQMVVYNANSDGSGDYGAPDDWGVGTVEPDDPDTHYGNPGHYHWLGDLCVVVTSSP